MVAVKRALLNVTTKSSVASAPSSTSASATESATGPAMTTWSPPASLRPSGVHTPEAVCRSTRDVRERQLRDEVKSGGNQPTDIRVIHRRNKPPASLIRHAARRRS